jgi:hypothetical protein
MRQAEILPRGLSIEAFWRAAVDKRRNASAAQEFRISSASTGSSEGDNRKGQGRAYPKATPDGWPGRNAGTAMAKSSRTALAKVGQVVL